MYVVWLRLYCTFKIELYASIVITVLVIESRIIKRPQGITVITAATSKSDTLANLLRLLITRQSEFAHEYKHVRAEDF